MGSGTETKVTHVSVRQKRVMQPTQQSISAEASRKHCFHSENLLKNLGVAAAFVLCATALRTGAIPPLEPAADLVLAAATDNTLLDEQLGKLSFVSALFPEAVLVFGDESSDMLSLPVYVNQVTHAWSQQEPYMAWNSDGEAVTASADGEVVGVFHGNGDEQIVKIVGDNDITCIYGNLQEVYVQTGDFICLGDTIGSLLEGADRVIEVQRHGISIDPALYIAR